MKSYIFWDITSCSPLEVNDVSDEYGGNIFSEVSVDFQRTTRRYFLTTAVMTLDPPFKILVIYYQTTRCHIPERVNLNLLFI
jgi:hypothetical protein